MCKHIDLMVTIGEFIYYRLKLWTTLVFIERMVRVSNQELEKHAVSIR